MTTIKDIAREAGVSVTTVSRALNGYSDVSEKTRKKIEKVAKELNYSPNSIARSLVMNKTKTIGLLVSGMTYKDVKDNFTFEILSGINECSSKLDYDLVLFNTNSAKQKLKTYTQLCRERRVDGVIITGIKTTDPYLKEVVESDIPCVMIDIPIKTDSVGFVTTDNIEGAKQAVKHLINLGHTSIAMINGYDYAFVSKKRLDGYIEALSEANIKVKAEWILNGEFSEQTAELQAFTLLKNYPEITAVFCASDLMAFGVMRAAKRLKLHVPNQLSIVGFDDINLSSYVSPSLTTITQDRYQMGYQAAELLISMLENRSVPHERVLNTRLTIRESTGQLK